MVIRVFHIEGQLCKNAHTCIHTVFFTTKFGYRGAAWIEQGICECDYLKFDWKIEVWQTFELLGSFVELYKVFWMFIKVHTSMAKVFFHEFEFSLNIRLSIAKSFSVL
jgi:hypothetical protein